MTSYQRLTLVVIFTWLAFTISMITTRQTNNLVTQNIFQLDPYFTYGQNLLSGQGYRNCGFDPISLTCLSNANADRAYRLPVYPLMLTPILIIGNGMTPQAIALALCLQSALWGATVGLSVGLACRWGLPAALCTGFLLLLSTSAYYLAGLLMTEISFTFGVMLWLYSLLRSKYTWHWLISGILFGILLEWRGVLLVGLPFFVAWIGFRRSLIIFLFGMSLPVAVWTARNYTIFNAFVPFSTGSGVVLYGANNPKIFSYAPGVWENPIYLEDYELFKDLPELQQDRAFQSAALEFLRGLDISYLIFALIFKVLAFFGFYDALVWKINLLMTGGIFIWSLIDKRRRRSRWRLWRRDPVVTLCLWLIATGILNTLIFWADYRMRFPFEPALCLVASAFLMNHKTQASATQRA